MPRTLALLLLLSTAGPALAQCPPPGFSRDQLLGLKAAEFSLDDAAARDGLAVALLDCLGDPDPVLRDGVGYEALAQWLRAEQLSEHTRQALLQGLSASLQPAAADPQGFAKPFAALVLSEVARSDRVAAWMSAAQREALVDTTANYLQGIRDYRGFEDGAGWRHGVAHSADLAMQLILNPAIDKGQINRLLAAVATQIAPAGDHAYVDGESERLARPVLYAARRGLHDAAEWQTWFAAVGAPAPLADWSAAFGSRVGLSKRHNVQAFLRSIYVNARDSENPAIAALAPLALQALIAIG